MSQINIYIYIYSLSITLLIHCNSRTSFYRAKWKYFLNEKFINEKHSVCCIGNTTVLTQFLIPTIYRKKSQSYGCIQGANRGCGTNVMQMCQHLPEFLTYSQNPCSEISYLGYFLLEAAHLLSHVSSSALQQYFSELVCTFFCHEHSCACLEQFANDLKLPIF